MTQKRERKRKGNRLNTERSPKKGNGKGKYAITKGTLRKEKKRDSMPQGKEP